VQCTFTCLKESKFGEKLHTMDLEINRRRVKEQLQASEMADEHREGPIDEGELRLVNLESQVANI
jgi:hypothetical protein